MSDISSLYLYRSRYFWIGKAVITVGGGLFEGMDSHGEGLSVNGKLWRLQFFPPVPRGGSLLELVAAVYCRHPNTSG